MKKKILIIILLALFLSSCRHSETFRFLNSTDEISSIWIVNISFNENSDIIQTELRRIEDVKAFLSDFEKVECYTWFGDPTGITEEGVEDNVIKIIYANEEYELINWNGQAEYTEDRGFSFYTGFSVFEEEEFEALIDKYLSE